jgi:hypothetical protein
VTTQNLPNEFARWLDAALSRPVPPEVRAFSFNLYEGVAHTWNVQLSGTAVFDPMDSDWACDPIFSYPELLFIPHDSVGDQWEQALAVTIDLIATYIRAGRHKDILRGSLAVGVGFVDGDLTVLWPETHWC